MIALAVLPMPGVHADPAPDGALPPWALVAAATGAGVELSWQAPPAPVDAYAVYRADDREAVIDQGLDAFHLIGQTTEPGFVDPGPTTDGTAAGGIYHVTSLVGGAESPPSNPVDAQYPHCWNLQEPVQCFVP